MELSPKLRELTEQLRTEMRQHTANLAEVERAESDVREADAELRELRARIAEKEADLARSGAPVSDAAFVEDKQLAQAERRKRVLALRADASREKARQSQAGIERLKAEIETAWLAFGKEKHHEALLSFAQAAAALADRYRDLVVWSNVFRSLSLPVPEVVVEDLLTRSCFINTQDIVWSRKNQPEARDLYRALSAVRAEIEQVKGGH